MTEITDERQVTADDVRHRADLVRRRAVEFGEAVTRIPTSRFVLAAAIVVAVAVGIGYMAGSSRRGGTRY